MPFIKLERGNDWGHVYFALPGKDLWRSANAYPLKEGQDVRVLWPDGSDTDATIKHKRHVDRVGDHGHSYDVEFMLPGVVSETRGLSTWIPLDAVSIWVTNEEAAQVEEALQKRETQARRDAEALREAERQLAEATAKIEELRGRL